jgi:hypothetical protein
MKSLNWRTLAQDLILYFGIIALLAIFLNTNGSVHSSAESADFLARNFLTP